MRRQHHSRLALIAVCMAACLLLSCCAAAAHTAGHACFHYDNCHLCQQFDFARLFAMLALAILSGCIFLHSRMNGHPEAAKRCFVPVTLISQSIQMND